MTSRFNAKIEVDAEEKTNAVFDSVNIDNKFYPENPTKTEMFCDDKITILIESTNWHKCVQILTPQFVLFRQAMTRLNQ